jgi:hypothetical protein
MLAVSIAPVLLGPQPCDGPALPLTLTSKLKLVHAAAGATWSNGVYNASFRYEGDTPVSELNRQYKLEAPTAPRISAGTPYTHRRRVGAINQSVSIGESVVYERAPESSQSEENRRSYVYIQEWPEPKGPAPTRWFGPAISSKPPATMIEVPFLKGTRTDTVTIESLEGLLSGKGITYLGTDAKVYMAHTDLDQASVLRLAQPWFDSKGFSPTKGTSHFKRTKGIFEIDLWPLPSGTRNRMYVADKVPATPVARRKW